MISFISIGEFLLTQNYAQWITFIGIWKILCLSRESSFLVVSATKDNLRAEPRSSSIYYVSPLKVSRDFYELKKYCTAQNYVSFILTPPVT